MNISTSVPRTRRNIGARRAFAGIAVGVGILALGACNSEQRRGLGEIDINDELHGRVEQAVSDEGQSIKGDLDCHANIEPDGAMSASCEGVTDDGDDVSGALVGTADVEAEECSAALTITVADEVVVTQPSVACFS